MPAEGAQLKCFCHKSLYSAYGREDGSFGCANAHRCMSGYAGRCACVDLLSESTLPCKVSNNKQFADTEGPYAHKTRNIEVKEENKGRYTRKLWILQGGVEGGKENGK